MAEDPSAEAVGVLIIDDHRMFAESLARLLADEPAISVLGVAATSSEGMEMAARLRPRVVLVDYAMPERDGAQIAAEILREDPKAVVVMLTGSDEDRVLVAAVEAGCSGFLTKDRAATEVADVIRAAGAGELLLSSAQLSRLLPKLSRAPRPLGADLTERERDLLVQLARGGTTR